MKTLLKEWKLYEVVWLLAFSSVALILTVIWKDNLFGFSVFITGVLCVVLAAKGNIATYLFGMYNTFGYAWLAWNNHLFGEVSLNLLFFVPMNVVGFVMWKKNMNGNRVEMKGLSAKGMVLTGVTCILSVVALGYGLSLIPGQNNPYVDATTNVLSVIATILMVLRYKEQWLLYIVLNVFTVILWLYRLRSGSSDGAMMVVMWSAYLVNAIYGYVNWNRGTIAENL